jgi:hypothetical protein
VRELGTVERANEDDAIVKWDHDGLRKSDGNAHVRHNGQHLFAPSAAAVFQAQKRGKGQQTG